MSEMLKVSICIDCICVPMCLNKEVYKLRIGCTILDDLFVNLTSNLNQDEQLIVHVKGLNRTFSLGKLIYDNKFGVSPYRITIVEFTEYKWNMDIIKKGSYSHV